MWDGHTQFEAFRFPSACVSLESEGDAERELTRLEGDACAACVRALFLSSCGTHRAMCRDTYVRHADE